MYIFGWSKRAPTSSICDRHSFPKERFTWRMGVVGFGGQERGNMQQMRAISQAYDSAQEKAG